MIKSCNLFFIWAALILSACLPSEEVQTHQSLLVWTDSEAMSTGIYRLSANEIPIGELEKWNGDHGCSASGYIHYELPINQEVVFSLQSPDNIVRELVTIQIYSGGSGASIKRHNNTVVNLDGTSYSDCTLLHLNW